jgi:hypothetical protein
MCGRFTLRTNASDLVEIFTLLRDPELTPRSNIAPTPQQREESGAGVDHASVCVATFCASSRK